MNEAALCKSCGAEIFFAVTDRGAKMPVDKQPARLFVLHDNPDTTAPQIARSTLVYTSHFATCPNADAHRRPR